jgi:hypothetical protein
MPLNATTSQLITAVAAFICSETPSTHLLLEQIQSQHIALLMAGPTKTIRDWTAKRRITYDPDDKFCLDDHDDDWCL